MSLDSLEIFAGKLKRKTEEWLVLKARRLAVRYTRGQQRNWIIHQKQVALVVQFCRRKFVGHAWWSRPADQAVSVR